MAKREYDDDKMTDMKRSRAESKSEYTINSKPNEYGYGLCIRLEDVDLDKLGIVNLPAIGTKFIVEAVGVVESVHQSQSVNNKDDRCFSIQIQKLGLTSKIGGK